MPTFRLNIVFHGIELDDDAVFMGLGQMPEIAWRAQGDVAFATAVIDAPSALDAANLVVRQVAERVPSAKPIRLDDDLVAIPDIAGRIGVTREAVRHWANGERKADFPLPRGIVGDAIKVWAWSDVNRWLRDNLAIGDAEKFPTEHDAALINSIFAAERQTATVAAVSTWTAREAVTTTTEAKLARVVPGETWVEASSHRIKFAIVDGQYAAAA